MKELNERLVTLFCYDDKSAGMLMRSTLNSLCKVEAYHSNRKGDIIQILECHPIQLIFIAGSEEYLKDIYRSVNKFYESKPIADDIKTIIVAIPNVFNTQSLNFLIDQGYDLILNDTYQLVEFNKKFHPLYKKIKARKLLASKLNTVEITESLYIQIIFKFLSDHRLVKIIFRDYINRKYKIENLETLYKKTNKTSLLTELTHYFVEGNSFQRGLGYSAKLLKASPWSFRANLMLSKYYIAKSPERSLAHFLKTDQSQLGEIDPDFIFELQVKNQFSSSLGILNKYILSREDAVLDLAISAVSWFLYQPKVLRKFFVSALRNNRTRINITKKITQSYSKETGVVLSVIPILLAGKSYAVAEIIKRKIRELEDYDVSPKEAIVYSLMFSLLGRNSYSNRIKFDDNPEAFNQSQHKTVLKVTGRIEKEVKLKIKNVTECNNADGIYKNYRQYPLSNELSYASCVSLGKLGINDERFKHLINTSIFLETSTEKRSELRKIKSRVF
ncbi:hypothetical protein [uncultured Photobacterium sp.]|uniref:hypothetical protein n=1 Tax=uncultured Photobacterium sp. TaxID=173973 RepID=UPI0026285366|nr:hypothetical protein [uncultured Photobacterium sp.]